MKSRLPTYMYIHLQIVHTKVLVQTFTGYKTYQTHDNASAKTMKAQQAAKTPRNLAKMGGKGGCRESPPRTTHIHCTCMVKSCNHAATRFPRPPVTNQLSARSGVSVGQPSVTCNWAMRPRDSMAKGMTQAHAATLPNVPTSSKLTMQQTIDVTHCVI